MWDYLVTLTPDDEGGFVVTFPDVPLAITQGDDKDEAFMRAQDALETALEMYIDTNTPLPLPSFTNGLPTVRPTALFCAKLMVHQIMREENIRKSELAKRLHWHLSQVDRLLDLRHPSRLDQIEMALSSMGRRFVLSVETV